MLSPRGGLTVIFCVLGMFTGACAARVPTAAVPAHVPAQAAAAATSIPKPDPVADLIALSTRHFETAQRELQQGHLETAKTEFNRALDVVLESAYGARSDARIKDHFDRLVARISTYEVTALAQGDGFMEK